MHPDKDKTAHSDYLKQFMEQMRRNKIKNKLKDF
jgi:hypothetical protein